MSDLDFITCPDCGKKIPINEALTHQIRERLQDEVNAKIKDLQEEKYKITKKLELNEKVLQEKLQQKEEELKEKLRQDLLEQRKKIKDDLVKEAKAQVELEIEDLKKQNEENSKKLLDAQKIEIELRQERRKLEEQQKNLELEMIRKVDEEREKLSLKIQNELSEQYKLKSLEYEKKLSDMQKLLDDAQRKASATSERFKGEILELNLESELKKYFPNDEIQEVPKGILGADVIQIVRDVNGRICGKIIWESKRTKAFSQEWITKLKDDVIRADGNFAILISQTLPVDIKFFDFRDGVWITDFTSYLQLVNVLRMNLFELKRVEKLNDGKDIKMSQLYKYFSSDQFKNKIVAVLESYKTMQEQLDKEKRAFARIWADREMQIKRMSEGTISIIGDMQGIMGNSLPKITGTELPFLD